MSRFELIFNNVNAARLSPPIRLRKWVFILLNAEKDLSASELLTESMQPISISSLMIARKYIGIDMRKTIQIKLSGERRIVGCSRLPLEALHSSGMRLLLLPQGQYHHLA